MPAVEPVQLVQQLQQRALNLTLATRRRIVALRAHRVDLINEHNARRMLVGDAEQLAHKLGTVAEVLLNKLRANNAQERRRGLVRDRFGQ